MKNESGVFWKDKTVLVTGATGMIGQHLVPLLLPLAAEVRGVSLDEGASYPKGLRFETADLRDFETCANVTRGVDFVFHLAGVKGSPKMTSEKPASFLVPTVLFNTNLLEACRINEVGGVLYTSSIGVYAPAPLMREDDLWNSVPSIFDIHAGYAKRLGELQIDSYKRQFSLGGMHVVRPANVYGPFDNFDVDTAMVIPSLVSKVLKGGNTLEVWGDGTPVRDFIHARDVARGMMRVVESGIDKPVNLGSGKGISIRELAEIFQQIVPGLAIEWKDLPGNSPVHGDNVRVLDVERANSIGFSASTSLLDGVKETLEWCRLNSDIAGSAGRYSAFA